MAMRCFFIFLLSSFLLVIGCGNNTNSNPDEKTISIGKFRLSGSAESGQYAPYLFKIDRLIRDEFAQGKAWKVVESDRIQEIADLFMTGQDDSQSLLQANEEIVAKLDLPDVQYLAVGEIDGFDLVFDDAPVLRENAGHKTVVALTGRRRVAYSRISLRVVDIKNKTWLLQKTIHFKQPVDDQASAETQINTALSTMAAGITGEIQLADAGMPTVASINPDGSLLLNRGYVHGVRSQQQWSLSRSDGPVIDPDTGKPMAATGRIIGDVKITQILEDHSIGTFQGAGSVQVGDRVVFKSAQSTEQKSGFRQVRVAIGGFVLGSEVDPAMAKSGFFSELEARLLHCLQNDSGMKVIEQDSWNIKKLLAQQMLTDLNKGREPGLPMGTLSGVDYLLFGKIYKLDTTAPKDLDLNSLGLRVKQGKPALGHVRAHIYLQDVNTGELLLSQEINMNEALRKTDATEAGTKLLSLFSDEINSQFLLGIRPLRIEAVGLDEVMLNHGASAGLSQGMQLTVYSIGDTRQDVYTGALMEGIGSLPVARLEISGFSPKGWARARIIKGSPEKGMPVQLDAETAAQKQIKETKIPAANW